MRFFRPLLSNGAKAIDSEALVTVRNIVSGMAVNTDPNVKISDIVTRNMGDSVHSVITNLSGLGLKRKRKTTGKSKKPMV